MAALGPAVAIASGLIGAIGSIAEGNAVAQSEEYNAQIAERNKLIADQNRKQAINTANVEAEDKRRENRRVLSSIAAAYGSSGLTLEGSPLDVLEDTATEQALDVRRIEYEGRARAREGAIQMLELDEEATLRRMRKRSARIGSYFKAAGSVVRGAGGYLNSVTEEA